MKTLLAIFLMLALLPTAAQAQYGRTANKRLPVLNPSPKLKNPPNKIRNPHSKVLNPKPGLERMNRSLRPTNNFRRR